jgi:hypothetical protein
MRDLNFKCLAEGKGATVTARFGPDGLCNGKSGTRHCASTGIEISAKPGWTAANYECPGPGIRVRAL